MWRAALLSVAVCLASAAGGCLRASERDVGVTSSDGPRDSADAVNGRDIRLSDAQRKDVLIGDGPQVEVVPLDIRSAERIALDATFDGIKRQDLGVADAAHDAIKPADLPQPVGACAGNGKAAFSYSSTMVICQNAAIASNQCTAAALCNATGGWQLCTATQFLARGGASQSTPLKAWIASCMRTGPNPKAPDNATCGSCVQTSTPARDVAWPCTGAGTPTQSTTGVLGVSTNADCRTLGVNAVANRGYWTEQDVSKALEAAVCCAP